MEAPAPAFVALATPLPLRYAVLEGKYAGATGGEAYALRLARGSIEIAPARPLAAMTDLRLNLSGAGEALDARDFYGKVIRGCDAGGAPAQVRLTAVPPEIDAFFEALRRYGTRPTA